VLLAHVRNVTAQERTPSILLLLALVTPAVSVGACGGTVASNPTQGSKDGGHSSSDGTGGDSGSQVRDGSLDAVVEEGGGDGGADSSLLATYPAFVPDIAQVIDQGGAVLGNPQIITVTWATDPSAAYFQSFGDELGTSQYWKTVSEYGVGPVTSGPSNHVSLTTPPPSSFADSDIVSLIALNAGRPSASGWPAPTPNSMYVLFLPPGVTLLLGGQDACQSVGGYHDSLVVGGQNVAYAAIPQCEGGTSTATEAASHEIGEGSADPYPSIAPAYLGFNDHLHLAWDVFQAFQDEVADACEFYTSSFFADTEPGFSFSVQRLWSNKSAAAGHDPCLPAAESVYFNTTLIAPEDITVDMHENGGPTNFATKGVRILPGQTKTFPIGFYSDGPTAGPWTILAYDGNPVNPISMATGPHLTISLDVASGLNGDKANVTVTVTSAGDMNAELLTIESRLGTEPAHWMPILIGSQ
jgi:hypothetical protein